MAIRCPRGCHSVDISLIKIKPSTSFPLWHSHQVKETFTAALWSTRHWRHPKQESGVNIWPYEVTKNRNFIVSVMTYIVFNFLYRSWGHEQWSKSWTSYFLWSGIESGLTGSHSRSIFLCKGTPTTVTSVRLNIVSIW